MLFDDTDGRTGGRTDRQTDRRTDGRYQAYYLPALRSIKMQTHQIYCCVPGRRAIQQSVSAAARKPTIGEQ